MNEQYKHLDKYQNKYKSVLSSETISHCCSFCGAALDEDECFCPDCGSPRDGIKCPNCGTVSHRSFCSHCNTPLNELAREAVRQAKSDPAFQQAERLAAEMAELEKQIQAGGMSRTVLDTSLNAEARQAAGRYAELFGDMALLKVTDVPKERQKQPEKVLTGNVLQAAIEAYRQKAAELQRTLDSMLPPPQATPEEQRNFFCARKIMTVKMQAVKQEWVCNYCGCHHDQPSECAEPQLGGTWIMVEQPTPVATTIYG